MKNDKLEKNTDKVRAGGKQQIAKKQQLSDAPRQSHDTYFKAVFSDLEVSRDVLMYRLPKPLVELCDWSTLTLENSSVQSKLLRERLADAIFSVKLRDKSDLKVFYHVEHLSKPKRWTVLYCWNLVFEYLCKLRKVEGIKKLPLVIPLIVYQNPKPFRHSTDICDFFDDPELAREYMFRPMQVHDVCRVDEKETSSSDESAAMQAIMKHIWAPDFEKVFADSIYPYVEILSKKSTPRAWEALSRMFCYIECKANILNKENFVKMVGEINHRLEETMLTMAQQYRQEGKLEAELESEAKIATIAQQYRQEGKLEGKLEGEQYLIGLMLQRGGTPSKIAELTGIAIETIQKLAKAYFDKNKKKETEEV